MRNSGIVEREDAIRGLINKKLFAEDKMKEESMHTNIFVPVVIYYFYCLILNKLIYLFTHRHIQNSSNVRDTVAFCFLVLCILGFNFDLENLHINVMSLPKALFKNNR